MTATHIPRGAFASASLPANALVVLVGTSGSGKSTLARRLFLETQILSSDQMRAWISDDEADQSVSARAFEVLHLLVRSRLEVGRTTVVDATNVSRVSRAQLVDLARAAGRPAVAVVLDVSVEECVARDSGRTDRNVGRSVIELQRRALDESLPDIALEGFDEIRIVD